MSYPTPTLKLSSVEAKNLKDFSASIPLGITHISGPLGSGKTALIRDIISSEANNRIGLLANPATTPMQNITDGKIEGLPLTLFVSGDAPQSQAGTIGSSFGLDRELFQLFQHSPFINCFNCHAPFEIVATTDRLTALCKELATKDTDTLSIFLIQKVAKSNYDESIEKWRARGFEKLLNTSAKSAELTELLIEIDSLCLKDCSRNRLGESANLADELGLDLCVIRSQSTNLELAQLNYKKVASRESCTNCSHKILSPDFGQLTQKALSQGAELSEETWVTLYGRRLGPSLSICLKDTLEYPIKKLLALSPLIKKLPTKTIDLLDTLAALGFDELNLGTPLKECSFANRQLLNLVRAFKLAPERSLLLLDEPLFELSDESKSAIENLFENHSKQNGSVIIATHLSSLKQMCTHTVELTPSAKILESSSKILPAPPKSINAAVNILELDDLNVGYEDLYSSPNKTICKALKIQDEIATLFSSTKESRALGLKKSDFIEPDANKSSHNLISFNGLSLNQLYGLSLGEISERFSDILKITKKIAPAIALGISYLALNRTFSDLSLRERILATLIELILSKPKNKKIMIKGLLSLLPPELQHSTAELTKNSLEESNLIEFI